MDATEIRRLLELSERGRVTEHELLCLLIQSAAAQSPAVLAVHLPEQSLADLRSACESPPNSPEHVLLVELLGLSLGTRQDFAWETYRQECSQTFCDGAWQWHWYFEVESAPLGAA